jgi:hypothetical protein
MKKEDYAVGCIVAKKNVPNNMGEVIALVNNNVIVQWSSHYIERLKVNELLSEHEARAKSAELKAEEDLLNQMFENVKADCEAKLAQAGQLLKEVDKTVNEHGRHTYDLFNADTFEDALRQTGWLPSMNC